MVVGIVMGGFWSKALWHVASVGDAIIWRERTLRTQRTPPRSRPPCGTRGMNTLVLINIVMSLVMAVLVLWRTAMVFLSGDRRRHQHLLSGEHLLTNPATGAICTVGGPRLPWFAESSSR